MAKQIIELEGDEVKLVKYIELLKAWINGQRVGKLTLNFFKGGISSVNVEQTLKME